MLADEDLLQQRLTNMKASASTAEEWLMIVVQQQLPELPNNPFAR